MKRSLASKLSLFFIMCAIVACGASFAFASNDTKIASTNDEKTITSKVIERVSAAVQSEVTEATKEGEPVTHAEVSSGDFGTSNALHWSLDSNGTLTISGTGSMGLTLVNTQPWMSDMSKITKVVISEGATNIANYAFANAENLKVVSLPSSVKTIGTAAFTECKNLESINLGSAITSIGSTSFQDCGQLALTALPDSVSSIGYNAFYNCNKLAISKLPENLTHVTQSAFYKCAGITSLVIPAGVTQIDKQAFDACSGLTEITFQSKNAPTLGENALPLRSSLAIRVPVDATGYTEGTWAAYADEIYWPIVIQSAANGSAKADKTSAHPGQTVTLTPQPSLGYRVQTWNATPATLSITNNKFTMPAEQVTLSPEFVDISHMKFAAKVKDAYGKKTGAGDYQAAATVAIDAGTREGYTFKRWVASNEHVQFADATKPQTTFIMPDSEVTITAEWLPRTSMPSAGTAPESSTNNNDNQNPEASTTTASKEKPSNKAHKAADPEPAPGFTDLLPKTEDAGLLAIPLGIVMVGLFVAAARVRRGRKALQARMEIL